MSDTERRMKFQGVCSEEAYNYFGELVDTDSVFLNTRSAVYSAIIEAVYKMEISREELLLGRFKPTELGGENLFQEQE